MIFSPVMVHYTGKRLDKSDISYSFLINNSRLFSITFALFNDRNRRRGIVHVHFTILSNHHIKSQAGFGLQNTWIMESTRMTSVYVLS